MISFHGTPITPESVLADLAGKPTAELRVGLGRDMRLTAPELAARCDRVVHLADGRVAA